MSAHTTQFRISHYPAFSVHSNFPELGDFLKIKSISKGLTYEAWTKSDKDKFEKSLEKVDFSTVKVTYLSSESIFFFQKYDKDGQPDDFKTVFLKTSREDPRPLYSYVIAGDRRGIGEAFFFEIYLRLLKGDDGVDRFWLVPAYRHKRSIVKSKFIPLCEYPLFNDWMSDDAIDIESLGFKNEYDDDAWYQENDFGEQVPCSLSAKYSKNGVSFDYNV